MFGVRNTVKPLFNPDFVDPSLGIGQDGRYDYAHSRTYGGMNPNRAVYNYLRGMSPSGETLAYGGHSAKLSPETVQFLQATMPINRDYRFSKDDARQDITDEVTANIRTLYADQSLMQKFKGMEGYNAKIQTEMNTLYKWALAARNSTDPAIQAKAQNALYAVANAQKAFNTAQPIVDTELKNGFQQAGNKAMDFVKNNWWWMIPAGGALAYGLMNMGDKEPQEQQIQPMQQTPPPQGWKTPVATNRPGQPKRVQPMQVNPMQKQMQSDMQAHAIKDLTDVQRQVTGGVNI